MPNLVSLRRRFIAFLIDFLTIIVWGIILLTINSFIFLVLLEGFPAFDELGMNLISLTMIVPVLIYSIITENSNKKATIGKRRMKIQVIDVHFNKITLWKIIIRNVLKFLPWQFAHMMIFRAFAFNWELPPLWMAMLMLANILPCIWLALLIFRKDHRGLHDLVSGTIVVDIE